MEAPQKDENTLVQPEYCTTNHRYRFTEVSDMGRDMKNYFVGPMPPREFLDDFFPVAKLERNPNMTEWTTGVWDESISKRAEIESYDPFVEVAARFCPSLRVVNSSAQEDSSNRTKFRFAPKPDYCVYLGDVSDTIKTDLSQVEIVGEAKWDSADDPFVHPPVMENGKKTFWNFNSEQIAFDTAGQLTSYAAAQLVRSQARLIRWDRSGAIVTEPFEYNKQPHLAEFFRRYSEASPELRGVDTTVKQPTEEEVAEARPFLEEHLGLDQPLLNVSVPTEGGEARHFIIGVPSAALHSPPGRATRGSVAYDIEGKRLVYLKDTWRIDIPTFKKEGEIYEILKEKNVTHIAEYILSGDILDHVTETDQYAKKPWACWAETLEPHRHYRLVLGTIGRSLTKFKSRFEMIQAVRDAVQAHFEAFLAGILHCDVSVGNILIVDGRGILIDWDFSKPTTGGIESARSTLRTGTWQFMSAALLEGITMHHTLIDDLESCLYVILFASALYSKSLLTPNILRRLVSEVFDTIDTEAGVYDTRSRWLSSNVRRSQIIFPGLPLLTKLIRKLAVSFEGRYSVVIPDDGDLNQIRRPLMPPSNNVNPAQTAPTTEGPPCKGDDTLEVTSDNIYPITRHEDLLRLLDLALRDPSKWPSDDAAQIQTIALHLSERHLFSQKNIKTGMDYLQSDRPSKRRRTGAVPSIAAGEKDDLFAPVLGTLETDNDEDDDEEEEED